jgi:hypothetical protein
MQMKFPGFCQRNLLLHRSRLTSRLTEAVFRFISGGKTVVGTTGVGMPELRIFPV